ncbi:MAG TPA: ZIP family metal transporter [bacterium]|nr:ZIP family metal transporter [bacterium]
MMHPLLQNLLILASAWLGAFFVMVVGISHRQLCALISFAAGALFATTFFHIVPEALSHLSFPATLLALASGYFLFYFLSHYLSHVCPACSASHFEEHTMTDLQRIGLLLAIALGIHVIMDGIAIALGHELEGRIDFSIFLTLLVHKFPEGLALCALLVKTGFSKTKSLFATFLLESLTFLGWILGVTLLRNFSIGAWFYAMLVHIGGGFVYLALHAAINESKKHSPVFILSFFFIGVILFGLALFLPSQTFH